jgi:type II secretory pathway component HofQ
MLQILDWVPGEAAGWAAVIAGLSILTALLAFQDRRKRAQEAAQRVQAPRLQPVRDRNQTRAARDVARAAEVAAIQARAALQIDAVEHSLNGFVAQLATVMGGLAVRPLEPVRETAGVSAQSRQSLAA